MPPDHFSEGGRAARLLSMGLRLPSGQACKAEGEGSGEGTGGPRMYVDQIVVTTRRGKGSAAILPCRFTPVILYGG